MKALSKLVSNFKEQDKILSLFQQQGNKKCKNYQRMYRKYLFFISPQKYSSRETIPLNSTLKLSLSYFQVPNREVF
jgi:hypothetical protein